MVNKVVTFFLGAFFKLVDVLPLPEEFMNMLDSFFSFLVQIFTAASWLVPMNLLVICLGVIFVVDNFQLIAKLVLWLIERIPFL